MAENQTSIDRAREYLREKLFSTTVEIETKEEAFLSNKSTPKQQKKVYCSVKKLLQCTILDGVGNTAIIVGPRGSGKTLVVNQVLSDLNSDPKCSGNFLLVRLNGWMHTDDRLAMLDIAAQLDTAAQLDLEEKLKTSTNMSFSEALSSLVDALRSGSRSQKSVIFVLEEFDLFTFHKNQTLIYNLFDISQASKTTPIAVIGLTHRLDVVELLEKRIKSRFSHHRSTLLMVDDFEDYVQHFKGFLALPNSFEDKAFLRKWRKHIEELMQLPRVVGILKQLHSSLLISPSLFLTIPVCRLGSKDGLLALEDLEYSFGLLLEKDERESIIGDVSVLELCLLIAMSHITEISEHNRPFNFEMVYSEYKKFTQRYRSAKFFSRAVALKGFEHLVHLGLVCPAATRGGGASTGPAHQGRVRKTAKEFQQVLLVVSGSQIRSAVKNYPNCPTDIYRWGLSNAIT